MLRCESSNKQYYALRNELRNIAQHYHMKEAAQAQLANMLRFKFNVGGLKEIPADAYDKACAIVEFLKQQDDEILTYRIEQDREIINHLCQGIPFTATIRKQYREKFSMKLPHNPNWRQAVDMIEGSEANPVLS